MTKTILMLITLTALAACNTFEGMGKDITNAGEALTGTAKKAKDEL